MEEEAEELLFNDRPLLRRLTEPSPKPTPNSHRESEEEQSE